MPIFNVEATVTFHLTVEAVDGAAAERSLAEALSVIDDGLERITPELSGIVARGPEATEARGETVTIEVKL